MAMLSLSSPVVADSLSCTVAPVCATGDCGPSVQVAFDIDHTQFAPAQDAGDPPRRKVTTVRMGDAEFPAEAIVMGDTRGFWAEGLGGRNVLFIVQGDGSAHYAENQTGLRMAGTCDG